MNTNTPALYWSPCPDTNRAFLSLSGVDNNVAEVFPVDANGWHDAHDTAKRIAEAVNLPTDPRIANARALYESVTKGATLTGTTARLALQLGNVLAAIDGQAPSPYAPAPRWTADNVTDRQCLAILHYSGPYDHADRVAVAADLNSTDTPLAPAPRSPLFR